MKIDIVIMASGSSERFGNKNKLLQNIKGKPMFQYAVDNAIYLKSITALVDRVIVVSIYNEIEDYCRSKDLIYVNNVNSREGISASIHIGIENSNINNDIMFMVCDQPYLKRETILGFLKGYTASKKSLGCITFNDKLINPCVFSKSWKDELLKISGDKGGKKIIKDNIDDVFLYNISNERELRDIDEISQIYDFPFFNEKGHIISIVGAGGKTSLMYYLAENYCKLHHKVIATTTTHIYKPKKYKLATTVNDAIKIWDNNEIAVVGSNTDIAACRADKRNFLSRLNVKRKVLKYRLALLIREHYVLKINITAHIARRSFSLVRFRLGVHKREHSLRTRDSRLYLRILICDFVYRT